MKRRTNRLLNLLCLSALIFSSAAVAQGLNIPSEVFQPPQQKSVQQTRLKLPITPPSSHNKSARPNSPVASLTLAAPTETELQSLQQYNRRKAFQVGIRRELPTLPALTSWHWQPVDGGQAAHFVLTSGEASRLRVLLQAQQALPVGVEIRIYDRINPSTVKPTTKQCIK